MGWGKQHLQIFYKSYLISFCKYLVISILWYCRYYKNISFYGALFSLFIFAAHGQWWGPSFFKYNFKSIAVVRYTLIFRLHRNFLDSVDCFYRVTFIRQEEWCRGIKTFKDRINSIEMIWVFIFGTFISFWGDVVRHSVVFPLMLRFLYTNKLGSVITNQLISDTYMNNFLMLAFMIGIMFELLLLATSFSKLELLIHTFFKKYQRYAIVILLMAAAMIITLSSYPFSLMAVFFSIYMLWEMNARLVKAGDMSKEWAFKLFNI